jgi:hypothetical protein
MLGVLAMSRGETEEARAVFEELLKLWSEGNQVCDFRSAALLCDLAMLEHRDGNEKKARMYANRAMFMSKAPSARDHPDVLRSLKAVAVVLSRRGSMVHALERQAGPSEGGGSSSPCCVLTISSTASAALCSSLRRWKQRLPARRGAPFLLPCVDRKAVTEPAHSTSPIAGAYTEAPP